MAYVASLDITNATSTGLIVANQASVPAASAATVTVNTNGAASNCVVSTGGSLRAWPADGTGVLDTVTVYDGTLFVRSSGNVGRNLTFSGGIGYLQDNAVMSNVNIYGGTLSAYTGTLENATVHGGNLFAIFDSTGVFFSNTTVRGGTFIFRKKNNSATGVFLSGGLAYLQEGAKMTDVHVSTGATFHTIEGTVNGLTVYAGGQLVPNVNFKTSNVVINDLDVRAGGVAAINGTAVINGAKLAGNDNQVNISGDVRINNLSQTAGWTRVSSGVTISGATITGGALWLRDSGVYANDVFINNGSLYVDYEGTRATNVRIAGGQVNLRTDATMSGVQVTGGKLVGYNGVAEDILINGGGVEATYATAQVLFSNTTMSAGTLIIRSAANSAIDLDLYGGLTYLQEGATMSRVNIRNGATFYAIKGTLDSATVHAGGKIVLPGGWSPDAVTFRNMDVRAGASWTLYNNFSLAGNFTIESGASINGTGTYQTDV